MRAPLLRRATAVALSILVAVAAVAPVAADSRPRKTYPTHQERYRVGRAMTPSTDILSVSGYAAWMIDEALGGMTPLPRLGSAFMRAERVEGLNARYFIAHALLESGWGASDIARFKRNLFGYNAFDRDPWKYASSFRTYEKGIMAVAEKIRDSYLTPSGRFFYRFTTLRAMNVYYASDPNWATKIAYLANVVDRRIVTLRERDLRFGAARLRGTGSRRRPDRASTFPGAPGRGPSCRRGSASPFAGRRSSSSRPTRPSRLRRPRRAGRSSAGATWPDARRDWPWACPRGRGSGAWTSRRATATGGPCRRPIARPIGRSPCA